MKSKFQSSQGVALPAALLLILLISSVSAILSTMSAHSQVQITQDNAKEDTYLAAEGAVNKQISELAVLGSLWAEKTNLSSLPNGYTEYAPLSYTSTNGIPTCSGVACHRDLYPIGGGLIKNLGPVNGDGDQVETSYSITQQLDTNNLPTADSTLSGVDAWTQVERLDTISISSSNVGFGLSNSLAEGGNANSMRFRITGTSLKSLKDRKGYATVMAIVEMPVS